MVRLDGEQRTGFLCLSGDLVRPVIEYKNASKADVKATTPQSIKLSLSQDHFKTGSLLTMFFFTAQASKYAKILYIETCVTAHCPHHPPCPPLCYCVHRPWPRYHWSLGWPGFLGGRLCPQLYKKRNNMIRLYGKWSSTIESRVETFLQKSRLTPLRC